MEIDYYAYEYSVIKRLIDIFKIEIVEHNKEVKKIGGFVKEIVLNDYIELINNKFCWHYCINKNIIIDAFKSGINIEYVVNMIKKEIEYDWIKEIKK